MSEGGVSSSHSRLIIHSASTCCGPDTGNRGWHAEVHPREQRARADGYNLETTRLSQPTQACGNEAPGGGFVVLITPGLGEEFLGQKGHR